MVPRLAILLAVLAPLIAPARADGVPARLGLIDGWSEPDGRRMLGLVFDLDPGWKTYWRAPGEAGIPPSFDFTGSANVAGAEFLWPAPHVFDTSGLRTLGFSGRLVLPVRLTLTDPAAPFAVSVAVSYGICSDICIPAESAVFGDYPAAAPRGPEAEAIEQALRRGPVAAAEAGVTGVNCTVTPGGETLDVTARVDFGRAVAAPDLMVLESPLADLWIPPAAASLSGQTVTAQTRAEWFGAGPLALDRSTLRLTLISGDGAVEINGCPAPHG